MTKFSDDANTGWCFYRGTYAELDRVKNLKEAEKLNYQNYSNSITSQPFKNLRKDEFTTGHFFELTLAYPGMLVGSGYQHESGADGEFKIGFYFDYTTGLPEVPGSSVKGMLRSNFPGDDRSSLAEAKVEWISTLINEILDKQNNSVNLQAEELRRLELEIFEGVDYSKPNGNFLSIYRRDCFYGALLSPANRRTYPFLGSDYVTPHPDKLKDPVPLMFLKVLPGVILLFNFRLVDSYIVPEVTKEVKLELFKQLLLAQGIGAKTNVGYGQFIELSAHTMTDENKNQIPDNELPDWVIKEMKAKKEFDVELGDICDDYFEVLLKKDSKEKAGKFYKNKYKVKKVVFYDFKEKFTKESKIILRVNQPYINKESFNFTILLKQ